ncbi:MAG TPA: sigma-54 dependent transcriptional regulator [Bryobacteraceae bacterium]
MTAQARARRSSLPLIFVTVQGAESAAVAAVRCRADDYFALSNSSSEFREVVCHHLDRLTAQDANRLPGPEQLIGGSSGMVQVREDVWSIAQSDSTVLITGETGTGKELVASLIHYNGARRAMPLTTINCAAIPDTLFESELFGYERGAFTGANTSYDGKVKASNGGTVFLDEVGDLSPFAQAKLLRLLDTKEVQRLGDVRSYRVDVRIIAATHRDLDSMVRDERFRPDLYFRLNVARVRVPALRERASDIAPIAEHILRILNTRLRVDIRGFEHEALECLLRYAWPGNVRELRNVLEGILIRRRSGCITVTDLPEFVQHPQSQSALPEDELARMLLALESTEWNKSKAAEKLHWSRMTLYRKIAKYNVLTARKARGVAATQSLRWHTSG